ncbi:MAG: outer membrane protein assembly factor BamD [Candidatus Binatia bacterium]|nr:outer membrane protein assembly factor BamD [Candidatus Binatia bacterium]
MVRGFWFPWCGVALLLLSGCSSTVRRLSAKEYYTQASEAFMKEDFTTAADQYRELLDQYPLNPYAEEAQLKIAYAYYLDKKYSEAIAAFSDFERAYPTSAHLPFVEYYRGMCYLEQMRSIDRDQSVTEKAHDFFQAVVERFPESPFAPLAREKIKICREAMAGNELYVARFNEQLGNLLATKVRLRTIVEKYPETEAALEALTRLQTLLSQEGNAALAELAAQALTLRRSPRPAETNTPAAWSDPEDLPAAESDPLRLLVAELKQLEDYERAQARGYIEGTAVAKGFDRAGARKREEAVDTVGNFR